MKTEAKKEAKTAEEIWRNYQDGLSYQSACGLAKNLPVFVRFYEGKQWAAPTENTKSLPRPVINIIKMICRSKKSAILSSPVRLIYTSDSEADVDKFNKFAAYIQKEIGQERLDKDAMDDGVKKGTYVYHYYWDADAEGKDGVKEGALRCEIIDPLSIFFANPLERDEQKQKWILVATREDVDSVRAKCDRDIDPESITPDEFDDKYGVKEQDGEKLCTVLTEYYRIEGEVYCVKATRKVIVNKPFAIAPNVEAASAELSGEDAPNNSLPDAEEGEDLSPKSVRAGLYPIVVGNYERREKSIFGLGEVEGLIPNQKAINFNYAMLLLSAQQLAWGKYIVDPNALQGQTISNEPGQVLVDYTKTGRGIRRMEEPAMPSQPLTLIDTLMQMTRAVTGTSEVMTGEVLGANMSGAAIAQLQSQAQQPIAELKDAFWLTKEKQGMVLAQFFKLFYAEKEFSYTKEVQRMENGQPTTDDFGNSVMDEVTQVGLFNSSEYEGVRFSVVVEATAGAKTTAAGDINALDTLLNKGLISRKTYLMAYPEDALSNRTAILQYIDQEEREELASLRKQVETLTAQLEESVKIVEQQRAVVDKVAPLIRENSSLKSLLSELYNEAHSKIQAANEEILRGNQRNEETVRDAQSLSQFIYDLAAETGKEDTVHKK